MTKFSLGTPSCLVAVDYNIYFNTQPLLFISLLTMSAYVLFGCKVRRTEVRSVTQTVAEYGNESRTHTASEGVFRKGRQPQGFRSAAGFVINVCNRTL
jgi:hypothetical protein